ncbi:MAG: hypothetical protein ABSH45_04315 [Bryobacteraceae bacterium]|jgi:hypothetical protein
MKRKLQPKPETIVPPEILELAQPATPDLIGKVKAGKCSVCGGETSESSSEALCWVCRRLKISAWRDAEQQMPMQE